MGFDGQENNPCNRGGTMIDRENSCSSNRMETNTKKKMELNCVRSAQESSKNMLHSNYFSFESLLLLTCLTISLLILPLVLPPLPPPPFLLLLIPIAILFMLVVLAFMPFNSHQITYHYV